MNDTISGVPEGGDPSFGQKITGHSSQAGLASIRAGRNLPTPPTKTITFTTASGIKFTLKHMVTLDTWQVIFVNPGAPANAQAQLHREFVVGEDPWVHPAGYAALIQQALNNHHGLHSAFGRGKPQPIITEVPL